MDRPLMYRLNDLFIHSCRIETADRAEEETGCPVDILLAFFEMECRSDVPASPANDNTDLDFKRVRIITIVLGQLSSDCCTELYRTPTCLYAREMQ